MTTTCPHCSGQLEIVAAVGAPAPSVVLDLTGYGSPSALVARLRRADFHTIADQIEAHTEDGLVKELARISRQIDHGAGLPLDKRASLGVELNGLLRALRQGGAPVDVTRPLKQRVLIELLGLEIDNFAADGSIQPIRPLEPVDTKEESDVIPE
jgi:hypothetical protein